jgi:hypothetical protein
MSKNLIGFCAKKRAGKDTAGQLLIQQGYIRYAFADPLKKACEEIFMFNNEQMDGSLKETIDPKWGISPRKIFQIFGTEIFREKLGEFFPEMKEIQNNFWIYRFELWYKNLLKQNPDAKVVVTDVRFENEANIIKKLGGIIIKIERNTGMNIDNHASEKNIDLIKEDINIKNNSTIKEYYDQLKEVLK